MPATAVINRSLYGAMENKKLYCPHSTVWETFDTILRDNSQPDNSHLITIKEQQLVNGRDDVNAICSIRRSEREAALIETLPLQPELQHVQLSPHLQSWHLPVNRV
jgi:hypothetical protein